MRVINQTPIAAQQPAVPPSDTTTTLVPAQPFKAGYITAGSATLYVKNTGDNATGTITVANEDVTGTTGVGGAGTWTDAGADFTSAVLGWTLVDSAGNGFPITAITSTTELAVTGTPVTGNGHYVISPVAPGDTVTVNGTVLTAIASGVPTSSQFLIAAAATIATNINAAISANPAFTDVLTSIVTTRVVTMTAFSGGTVGNASALTISGATFSGGEASTQNIILQWQGANTVAPDGADIPGYNLNFNSLPTGTLPTGLSPFTAVLTDGDATELTVTADGTYLLKLPPFPGCMWLRPAVIIDDTFTANATIQVDMTLQGEQ